jgi:2-oxo-4-hydroxy-4-carboxy-5-ureidoimidazoline decarboxylase
VTIAEVNDLSREAFLDRLGKVYEHSPWVAEKVWSERPFASRDQLRERMRTEVENSGEERQLALLRAHPDLGTRARIGELSANEQRRAGLDHLIPEEYKILLELNTRYSRKFGFPFICAVRGLDKEDILAVLMIRLDSSAEVEFSQALWEVHRIAAFRLNDLIDPQ